MASSQNEDDLFFDNSMSLDGNPLFPPDMLDSSSLLNVPNIGIGHMDPRHSPSISGASDTLSPSAYQQAFSISGSSSSRLPSLSPSTQSLHLSASGSGHAHSPRSTSSPSSNSTFSLSANDDFFNSFSSSELDMLFLADDNGSPPDFMESIEQSGTGSSKPGQSLNLPGFGGQQQQQQHLGHRNPSDPFSTDSISSLDFLQNLLQTSSYNNGFAHDGNSNLGMLNLDPAMHASHRKASNVSDTSSLLNFDFAQQARAIVNNGGHPQSVLPAQTTPQNIQPQNAPVSRGQNGWAQPNTNGQPVSFADPSLQQAGYIFSQTSPNINEVKPDITVQPTKTKVKANASKARSVPQTRASGPSVDAVPAVPTVGKHNKTERRYRQKVQAAQADLRDAIPALRVLYETSTEEQKQTTDFRAADGTVDGLGEVTRPNASAKATILIGARMYIELLQKRSAMLQRKVDELEAFRSAVAGQENLRQWQADFDGREQQIQAAADAAAALQMEEDSLDEDDDVEEEEEENERKRKKPKTAAAPKAPRAKPGPKSKKAQAAAIAQTAADGGLRVFAAFAMSFSFIPSASTVLKQTSTDTNVGQVLPSEAVGSATTRQILSRIPLITAEHTSRLLARGLPAPLVPSPHALVDWTWRLLVAVILAVSMGPIVARWTKETDEKRKAGDFSLLARDCAELVIPRGKKSVDEQKDEAYWIQLAAGIVGGAVTPSRLERWHVILHLNNTADDAYSLALLALLQPELPILRSPQQIWRRAQSKLNSTISPALATVLRLPLTEVHRCAHLLEKTFSPIAAIAEQITLVHVHDLYSRFFIRLVDASTRSKSLLSSSSSLSTKNLLANLESCDIGSNLKTSAFDWEIRTVIQGLPRGSAAHALGLVLIGLWGIFTRPAPKAQAALASALAIVEVQGAGAGLSSVSAMLELLYPGTKDVLASRGVDQAARASHLPKNAIAIDKLAAACIEYIKLLTSSIELNEPDLTRGQRLEASRKVQKDTAHLRLVLTQTKFVGVTGDIIEHDLVDERHSDSGSETGDESETAENEAVHHVKDVGLENEERRFAMAKERLVKVLCLVGRRAAGRAGGRDEDSGLEGDLDEL
ncbi:hypothetical protein I317_01291 [Kwoniella heveanensis CBS 569]|nr:hypothetical protein I317_01291 [Kwoniella heveanensis CBS 569]